MGRDGEPLNGYERRAQADIEAWKNASPGRVAAVVGRALKPVDIAIGRVVDIAAVRKSIEGVVGVAMDASTWTVQTERILTGYQAAGYDVHELGDIPKRVPLEHIDKRVSQLGKKYRATAGGEGAGAGAAATFGTPMVGVGALVADVALLTTWSCRAVAEYGAYYGFDAELHGERALALQVLSLAASYDKEAKQAALVELGRISGLVAKKKTWEELEKSALVRSLQQAAKAVGVRLTKAKLAQLVMLLGAFIGGGYNAWYLGRVCDAAYYTYRERYLETKISSAADSIELESAEVVEYDGSDKAELVESHEPDDAEVVEDDDADEAEGGAGPI